MEINNDFIFDIDRFISISLTQKALKEYAEGFEFANSLGGNLPIFLDTNVLLEFYKISFSERKEVKQFLSKNKDRIYLTHQIELEFLKHRIDHINSYQKSLDDFLKTYSNIREEIEKLKNGNIGSFNQYISTNKILINDYDNIRVELTDIYNQLSVKLKEIFEQGDIYGEIVLKEKQIEEIKKKLEGEADIERNDDLLDLIAEFKVVPELSQKELEVIIQKYDLLKEKYDKVKTDGKEKVKNSFPSCGENKKTDKTGDFILYHEILKFMKINNTNVIFLTSDLTKDDWLLRNKGELVPFTHYLINNYVCTNQIMYIFPAKDKIRISYDKVYSEVNEKEILNTADLVSLKDPNPINENDINLEMDESITIETIEFNRDEHVDYQLKVIEKIDLEEFSKSKRITEETFIQELQKSQDWAFNYGGGFVGSEYFINKILGSSKKFDIKYSKSILAALISNSKVERYMFKPDVEYFPEVEALRIKE